MRVKVTIKHYFNGQYSGRTTAISASTLRGLYRALRRAGGEGVGDGWGAAISDEDAVRLCAAIPGLSVVGSEGETLIGPDGPILSVW